MDGWMDGGSVGGWVASSGAAQQRSDSTPKGSPSREACFDTPSMQPMSCPTEVRLHPTQTQSWSHNQRRILSMMRWSHNRRRTLIMMSWSHNRRRALNCCSHSRRRATHLALLLPISPVLFRWRLLCLLEIRPRLTCCPVGTRTPWPLVPRCASGRCGS